MSDKQKPNVLNTDNRLPIYITLIIQIIFMIVANACTGIRVATFHQDWRLPVAVTLFLFLILDSALLRSKAVKAGYRTIWPNSLFWLGWMLSFVGILIANIANRVSDDYLLWTVLSLMIIPFIWSQWSSYKGGMKDLSFIIAKAMVAGSYIYMLLNIALTPFVERAPKEPLFEYMGFTSHPNTNGMICGGFLMAAAFLLLTDSKNKLLYSISFGFSLGGILASNCRSAELGMILAFVFGGIYHLRHRGLPGKKALGKAAVCLLLIIAVCAASFTYLRYIDHLYLIEEGYTATEIKKLTSKKNTPEVSIAVINEDLLSNSDRIYRRINNLSSDRLTIWNAYIPQITAEGHGEITGRLTEANRASYSAHNNVIEVLYISGYAAGIGMIIWMLYCLLFIVKCTFGRGPYREQNLLFIMSFIMFFSLSMLDLMQYPFERIASLMTYLMMGTVAFRGVRPTRGYRIIKRLLDIMVGIVGLILILPIIVIVKIAQIVTGDHGPLFYTQTRVGLGGRFFKIYKFRSMTTEADKMLDELLKDRVYRDQWVARQKLDDDPRVTGIGKILRKTAMDELPQVLNILKGDMSLIGPRPLVPGELENHGGLPLYNTVRPGMTGWWICNGHSSIDYDNRLQLEYHYVINQSLSMDVSCLIKSVTKALTWKKSKADSAENVNEKSKTHEYNEFAEHFDKKVSVIIPTLNAAEQLPALLSSLEKQKPRADEIIVVDSGSEDDTCRICEGHPAVSMIEIPRGEYNHGGTRDIALKHSSGDVVVFLTQDALPAGRNFLNNLISPLDEEGVAVSTGRQIARYNTSPAEKLIRAYNYPETSFVRSKEDIAKLGIKTYFVSNVCAAYKRDVYEEIGGFESNLKTNEDMFYAVKVIGSGYKIAYTADACVYHSHNLSLKEQYERNRIQGYEISRHRNLLGDVSLSSEGLKMVNQVSGELLTYGRILSFTDFVFDCCARYLGSRKGRKEGSLR